MPNKVNNTKPVMNNAARARMNARRRALYNAKKAKPGKLRFLPLGL
jgi:hypothetical protein